MNKAPGKHGQILVKVRSQHINVDNCGYSQVRKSDKPNFCRYPQMSGDLSQKNEDMQRFVELCR